MDQAPGVFDQDTDDVLAIDQALDNLRLADPRKAEVVEMRYFAGLSIDQTAAALGVSARTVDTEWRWRGPGCTEN